MDKCPYCGFDIKEGDVFCMNCGAALDEDFHTEVETPKKKKHTALWIILGVLIVLIAGAAIFLLNRPELVLAKAAKKTYDELKQNEALTFITDAATEGSIEVNMELKEILSGFSIPMLDEIDARASVKVVNDAEDSERYIKVTGSLGGSDALGADFWVSPEHMIVKSPTLIGRKPYGVELDDSTAREEMETLIQQYAGIDVSGADEYVGAIQEYLDDKKDINKKILPKLYLLSFKHADVKTQNLNYDFGHGDEKTKIISLTFDRDSVIAIVNELYTWAKDDEELKGLADEIDQRWITKYTESIPDGYKLTTNFYIDADKRLARVEVIDDSSTNAVELYDGRLTLTSETKSLMPDMLGDVTVKLEYLPGRNSRTDYSSTLSYTIDTKPISFTNECDIKWEKDSGRWEVYAGDGFKATGELYYDSEARKAEAIVSKIRGKDFAIAPNANIIVLAKDEMPDAPDFEKIRTADDVDAFVNLVTENVGSLISEFIADNMSDMIGGILGGAAAEPAFELPEAEDAFGTESETTETDEGADDPLGVEDILGAEDILETDDIFGAEEPTTKASESGASTKETTSEAATAQSQVEGETKAEAESKTNSAVAAEKESAGTSSDTNKETETETVKPPEKPVSGTYLYDDGKKFSMDFQTGEYTEHVTVKAKLNTDGTYELVYSNGLIKYNDEGTYDRDANNNMTFKSSTGINATGKYSDDYIEVTIPGYITEKLQKIK